MNIGRIFQRLALYRAARGVPLWVLVALSVGFYLLAGIGKAHAGTATYCGEVFNVSTVGGSTGNTQPVAYQKAMQEPERHAEFIGGIGGQIHIYNFDGMQHHTGARHYWKRYRASGTGLRTDTCASVDMSVYGTTDTAGSPTHTYNAGTECVAPEVPQRDGTCKDPDEVCRGRNTQPGFFGVKSITRAFNKKCIDGCNFERVEPHFSVGVQGGSTHYTGRYEWTGTCAANEPSEPPPVDNDKPEKASCEILPGQSGNTVQMCVKPDGKQCLTTNGGATTNDNLCWKPGETGEKSEGPEKHRRNPGTDTTPPTPPPGDTLQPSIDPVTQTTTDDRRGITIVTTTTGGRTTSGADAGGTNSGEPRDGGPDGGDEGEDKGSVEGGGECDNPPQVTGGDPLLANIIYQTWGTRCAGEGVDAVVSTGDVADCAQPFTVSTKDGIDPEKNANVLKLRALRASICGQEGAAEGGADGTYGTGDESSTADALRDGVIEGTEVFGEDGLNTTGYGWSRTCPQMPIVEVLGATVDFNRPFLCDWMQLGGWFVLLIGQIVGLRILAGAI